MSVDFAHDADLAHPWVEKYRIPRINTSHPSWRYEVALMVGESFDFSIHEILEPTEEEAAIIGAAIDYRRAYYRPGWANKMLERPLDVDSSTNTLILVKHSDSWRYRRDSWTQGPLFAPMAGSDKMCDATAAGLVKLLTESVWSIGDKPQQNWLDFMATNEVLADYADSYATNTA